MKVDFLSSIGFEPLTLPDPDREIDGIYIGDLLSWVMGRAKANDAWLTIMSNVNVLAVASLADVSCVILAEGVDLDENLKTTAESKGINVFKTDLPAFEASVKLNEYLKIQQA